MIQITQNISPNYYCISYDASAYVYDVFLIFFEGLVKYTYEYYDDNPSITTTCHDTFEIEYFSFEESKRDYIIYLL